MTSFSDTTTTGNYGEFHYTYICWSETLSDVKTVLILVFVKKSTNK